MTDSPPTSTPPTRSRPLSPRRKKRYTTPSSRAGDRKRQQGTKLAQAVAAKIRAVAKARGLSEPRLAKRLGVARSVLHDWIWARALPGPDAAERIWRWMSENRDYTYAPKCRAAWKVARDKGWRTLNVAMPTELYETLLHRAQAVGYPVTGYVYVAIDRLLHDEFGMANVTELAKKLEKGRALALLQGSPYLREILASDLQLLSSLRLPVKVAKPGRQALPINEIAACELAESGDYAERPFEPDVVDGVVRGSRT